MRAVMEAHQQSGDVPPLQVVIAKGKEDICVKISDQGTLLYKFHIHRLIIRNTIYQQVVEFLVAMLISCSSICTALPRILQSRISTRFRLPVSLVQN